MIRAMSRCGIYLAVLITQLAVPAWAEEGDGRPRWLPYLEVGLDLHKDAAKAEITTAIPNSSVKKRWHNTPAGIKMVAGLIAPTIEALPGKPRPFFDAGVTIAPETKQTLAETGNLDGAFDNASVDSTGQGIGSEIVNRHELPIANAAIGLEFVLPWVDQRFRLRPSVEYEWEKIQTTGKVVTFIANPNLPPMPAPSDPRFLPVKTKDTDTNSFHSMGLGTEIEFVVTGGLSLFLEARVLFLLSDDKISFSNSVGNTQYVYNRNDVTSWHGGFGVRYAFVGL